jgi:hypothetical protein
MCTGDILVYMQQDAQREYYLIVILVKQLLVENVGAKSSQINFTRRLPVDRLCVLVVRVPGCRSRDPGSIPGAMRFSEK